MVEVRGIKAGREYGGERGTEVVRGHGPLTHVRGSVTAVVAADVGAVAEAAAAAH
jgi:hypothetical protein